MSTPNRSAPRDLVQIESRFVSWLIKQLRVMYGTPARHPLPFGNKEDPVDELIYITLAQRTHVPGAETAFVALKDRFPSWEAAAVAAPEEIAALVEPSGLAFLKGPRITRMLNQIRADRGRVELNFLRTLSDAEAFTYLSKRLSAGVKTSWCVLLYSLGRDVFPADAHALRVLRRVGVLKGRSRHETVNRWINDLLPRRNRFELHVNLILHGRDICRSIPRCDRCMLRLRCDYATGKVNPRAVKDTHGIEVLRAAEEPSRYQELAE